MKKIVALFVITLFFVGSGISQIMRNVVSPIMDEEQSRATSVLTWSQSTGRYNMIGFEETTQFYAMQRFDVTDLSAYSGQQLTKIRFLPTSTEDEPTDATYSVVVYKGGYYASSTLLNTAGTLVCSQAVTDVTYGTWNTVTLNTPYTISASEELWIGVYVTANAGYVMAYDDTTVVADKGNLMGYDGRWGIPSDFFNSHENVSNWKIEGVVTDGAGDAYIDLAVRFVNNGTDMENITELEVPAGQPFRPVIVIGNVSTALATLDYTDTITISGYMDGVPFSTHYLTNDTVASGYGGWLQISEMTYQNVFAQGYCGTTHTFSYEVSATEGWNDADLSNNRDSITVVFGEYSTLYHITVVNVDSTISPSGIVHIYPGGNQRFVITPPEGQRIAQALADGVDVTASVHYSVGVGKNYTFYNVQSDHTFQVLYEDDEEDEDTTSVSCLTLPELSLYPNPTTGVVTIELSIETAAQKPEIQVFDVYGRLLSVVETGRAPSLQTVEIDLSRYSTGIYFVKLVNAGKVIAVQKVVKE